MKITGDLTLHGETHPIELEAELGGVETGPKAKTGPGWKSPARSPAATGG